MNGQPAWWRGATLYQVYVRSWRDTNADGVGDLPGVVGTLDYLEWLGVDCLWLSPTMPSPNTDYGYDVSDYCDVHPELGTLADLDRLVEQAAKKRISVMLDLVPNHTSDQHAWFIDALTGTGAEHRDYYVWAPPKPDGSPPNNWLDATGSSAWTLDEASGQYYLHNFLKTQPDLNWWEARVHREFEQILRFWFDRGIAGFRIDVAHGLYKDAQLRDDPAPTPQDHPVVRQRKLKPVYSSHRPEVHQVYERWREIADGYQPERALLGETWEFDPVRFGDFYGRGKPELHMGFNFTFLTAPFEAREIATVVQTTLAALPPGATPVWTGSNHDVSRFPSRWCGGDAGAARAALVLLAALPGTMVLYYGDELGMPDVEVPPDKLLDQMSISRPGYFQRDWARTPMPWAPGPNVGFTAPGVTPWLPVGDHTGLTVEDQKADPGSALHLSRRLNQLRREGGLGQLAPLETVVVDDQVWAFRTGQALAVLNLSPAPAKCRIGQHDFEVLVSTGQRKEGEPLSEELELAPWEALVARPTSG
jgi:alpha-glucosidase